MTGVSYPLLVAEMSHHLRKSDFLISVELSLIWRCLTSGDSGVLPPTNRSLHGQQPWDCQAKPRSWAAAQQKWGDSHKHLTSETAGNLSKAESRQPFHDFRDRFWFTLGVGIGLLYISQRVWRCSTNSAPPNTEIGRSTFMMSWIRSCTWEKGWVCSNERLRKDARY